MKLALQLFAVALLLCGCEPKPDSGLVLWEQPSPGLAALNHAAEIKGRAFHILPTGSMEPFLTGGDWEVLDPNFPFDKLRPGDLAGYQANWLPPTDPIVTHMVAARSGPDAWVMDGIHNRSYESGTMSMTRADYRGKIVQVYTTRPKP